MKKIGVLVGSLRKESYSRKLANNVMKMFPEEYDVELIEIGDLPLYNEEYDEQEAPETYQSFRDLARSMDAYLFVTPEYNRSVPAALKNALDVGSRPYGKSVWGGKPGAVISQSPSNLSGFGANHHLRQSLVFLDILPLQQPEAYIANSAELFDEKGNIIADETRAFLQTVVDAFVKKIENA